jgi:MoaA/NifB/PqqE/SkfB family radical SAM enzyme
MYDYVGSIAEFDEIIVLYFINTECNYNCEYCYIDKFGYKDKEDICINYDNINYIFDKFNVSNKILYIHGGEPLLEKEKLIKSINSVYDDVVCSVQTNFDKIFLNDIKEIIDKTNGKVKFEISIHNDKIDDHIYDFLENIYRIDLMMHKNNWKTILDLYTSNKDIMSDNNVRLNIMPIYPIVGDTAFKFKEEMNYLYKFHLDKILKIQVRFRKLVKVDNKTLSLNDMYFNSIVSFKDMYCLINNYYITINYDGYFCKCSTDALLYDKRLDLHINNLDDIDTFIENFKIIKCNNDMCACDFTYPKFSNIDDAHNYINKIDCKET